jgi:hypothetical protein
VRKNDPQATGRKGINLTEAIILEAGHLFQPIDGDVDTGIDGFIRLRKKVKKKKVVSNKLTSYEEYVETGNIVGVQVKTVSKIPIRGTNSYFVNLKDKTKFGVSFKARKTLDKKRSIWDNFVGPVILVFVDLETRRAWWVDLNDENVYSSKGYLVFVEKSNLFTTLSFKAIKKIGKELFATKELISIKTKNHHFNFLALFDFKKTAKEVYSNLSGRGIYYQPTINPTLGEVKYTRSGWQHITRLNRRKMRIFNSILLLGVSKTICEKVGNFTKVKMGLYRESERYIKKVDFLTLRANVHFNFRQSAIVQVVLRRVKAFDKIHPNSKIKDQVFFHSVYEPYRKE